MLLSKAAMIPAFTEHIERVRGRQQGNREVRSLLSMTKALWEIIRMIKQRVTWRRWYLFKSLRPKAEKGPVLSSREEPPGWSFGLTKVSALQSV